MGGLASHSQAGRESLRELPATAARQTMAKYSSGSRSSAPSFGDGVQALDDDDDIAELLVAYSVSHDYVHYISLPLQPPPLTAAEFGVGTFAFFFAGHYLEV